MAHTHASWMQVVVVVQIVIVEQKYRAKKIAVVYESVKTWQNSNVLSCFYNHFVNFSLCWHQSINQQNFMFSGVW